ncbi:MAG: DUF2178 domain-containing protein [Methanomassiliicoccales archaeon]|nr:DUF2178 domain-containing protein [Methanomassiliicoccales archaeon]
MDEKMRIWLMIGIYAVVLLGVVVMIAFMEGITVWSGLMLVIIVMIEIVAIWLAVRSIRDLRKGLPLKDEMSVAVNMRAGYRAFCVSIYLFLLLAVGFIVLEDQGVAFSNAELLFILVAIMGSIHIAFITYYNRKGRVP